MFKVVTSAHYLLSDLYISDDIHNQELLCNGSSDDSDYDDDQVRKHQFHCKTTYFTCKKEETKKMVNTVALMGYTTKLEIENRK